MKVNLITARKVTLAVVGLLAAFGIGYKAGIEGFQVNLQNTAPAVTITREVPVKNLNFSLFWTIWDTLQTSYFDKSKLIPSNMVYGAIKGMVDAVGDPYTVFLPPSDNRISNEDLQGNFEGVGIQIGFKGTQLAVMAPLPGSPAEKAGIKAGDFIVGIKDEAKKIDRGTTNISVTDAVAAIRGPAGTKVTLALLRDGVEKPIIVDLLREKINIPSVTVEYPTPGVAHIRLLKFGGETTFEWQKAISEVNSKKLDRIVLDLRNNPGGYLQASVDLAGEFLPQGSVAVIEEKASGTKTEFKTTRTGQMIGKRLVILVNGGSASASEILAGALRDNRKVRLIGEKTFGKGTIQEPQELAGGAGLHITIARWLTPSGFWVNEKGLEPDVTIKDNPDTENDEQLDEAVKLVNQ